MAGGDDDHCTNTLSDGSGCGREGKRRTVKKRDHLILITHSILKSSLQKIRKTSPSAKIDITIVVSVLLFLVLSASSRVTEILAYWVPSLHVPMLFIAFHMLDCIHSSGNPFLYLYIGYSKKSVAAEPIPMYLERAFMEEANTYEAQEANTYEAQEENTYDAEEANTYEAQEANTHKAPKANTYKAHKANKHKAPKANTYKAHKANKQKAPKAKTYEAQEANPYEAQEANPYEAQEANPYEAQAYDAQEPEEG
ncbi:A-kinase anchor protein 5-like isoform X5 [Hemicordylus capensis]|uniref:A-kinase anchor protein 5-like isoform X5 n=1 Tax=Hemicordylus capensis TaxID=884348 RepID=UPI0023043DCC|nr:A-kinase anchor protein 5-like isoform X5 [Hemicordylus capensis]